MSSDDADPMGADPSVARDPSVPRGADTLLGVLELATSRGYDIQFVARADGQVDCCACGRSINPAALSVERADRLEGASDAAEMMLVAWCTCPACDSKGTMVLGYGPNAGEGDTAVMPHLDLPAGGPGS